MLDGPTLTGSWALYIWLALPMGLLAVRLFYPEQLTWRRLLPGWLIGGWAAWVLVNYLGIPPGAAVWPHLKSSLVWGWLPAAIAFALYLLPYAVAVLLKRRIDSLPE